MPLISSGSIHFNNTGLSFSKKNNHYKNAAYFLYPLQWEEPFGLTFIEAMACGTPVIAFARGAVPEIVEDGKTGFIVNGSDDDKRGNWIVKKTGIEGICEAIKRISKMPDNKYKEMRRYCRKYTEKHFDISRMADDYEVLYKNLIEK